MARKAKLDRMEIAKVVVAPLVALFVAAVGWFLTTRYNASQLEIASRRGAADVEIARINAALRYMEFLRNVPEENVAQRRQAVAIAAPALPPELAFRIAIDQLPDDPAALDALMSKYASEAYAYLAKHLEVPFSEIKRALDPIPEKGPYAVQPTEAERRAGALLHYLRERGYSQQLFNFLTSEAYDNDGFRPTTLLLYFDEYRLSLRDDAGHAAQGAYERVRAVAEFQSYLRDESLSGEAKQAIAFGASIVFGYRFGYESDVFIREAAQRFWSGLDVARGATPKEGSLRAYLYGRAFHYYGWDAADIASAGLRDAIRQLDAGKLDFDNIRLILFGYATAPTIARDPAYLTPTDVVEVMRVALGWANTPEKRLSLSWELGSLSGDQLFMNMMPKSYPEVDDVKKITAEMASARCAAAKSYAEMLLKWYRDHYTVGWGIPKFLHEVVNEFPELEGRIDRKAWGLGGPWELGTSHGCR
jgi:hypothetical protein